MTDDRRFEIRFSQRAKKDVGLLQPKIRAKLRDIVENRLRSDPFSGKKLVGELKGFYSIRLSLHSRLVYRIDGENRMIYVLRARTHYEGL